MVHGKWYMGFSMRVDKLYAEHIHFSSGSVVVTSLVPVCMLPLMGYPTLPRHHDSF